MTDLGVIYLFLMLLIRLRKFQSVPRFWQFFFFLRMSVAFWHLLHHLYDYVFFLLCGNHFILLELNYFNHKFEEAWLLVTKVKLSDTFNHKVIVGLCFSLESVASLVSHYWLLLKMVVCVTSFFKTKEWNHTEWLRNQLT